MSFNLKQPFIPDNRNPGICAPCGGQCCKHMPGIVHPDDIEISEENLTRLIAEEGYAIDCWENNPFDDDRDIGRVYYMRPRTIKAKDQVFDFSWGGQCINLGDTGCQLEWIVRPAQCRALVPKEDHGCFIQDHQFSKQELAKAWYPYNDLLYQVGRKVQETL